MSEPTTGALEPDQKICPYCAEVIKAAAVKCRYCGSELPVEETSTSASTSTSTSTSARAPASAPVDVTGHSAETPEPPETVEPSEPVDPPEPTEHDQPAEAPEPVVARRGLAGPRLAIPLAGLAVVLGLVIGLVIWVFPGPIHDARTGHVAPDGQITWTVTRDALMEQAGKMTGQALSYDAKTFDADITAAGKLMTASFRKQYLATLGKVRADVIKHKLKLKADVMSSALISATDDQARVLEFVNQSTTTKGVKRTQLDQNRVVVTLSRIDGRWLISKLDAF